MPLRSCIACEALVCDSLTCMAYVPSGAVCHTCEATYLDSSDTERLEELEREIVEAEAMLRDRQIDLEEAEADLADLHNERDDILERRGKEVA